MNRSREEVAAMLFRVQFQWDSTPEIDLFGQNNSEKILMMEAHISILEAALDGFVPDPIMLFEQTCIAWLQGRPWDAYPELEKDKDGLWHTK